MAPRPTAGGPRHLHPGFARERHAVAASRDLLAYAARGDAARDAARQPEQRLMLAVLEEAVTTFQRHVRDDGRRGARLFREAEAWFVSEAADWPYSFVNICDALALDVAWLRAGLARWRESQRARPGADVPQPLRFRFRRVSGTRTRASGRPVGLRVAFGSRGRLSTSRCPA